MLRYRRGESTAAALAVEHAYYEWKAPDRPPTIHLSLTVMERLEADVMKGYWAVPKRGAEVGGVLIGRTSEDGSVVYVDDYEAVPCEYRRGPSYILSEADRRRLERTLRKVGSSRQVVGFYRSHTRPGLYLDEHDNVLLGAYFQDPRYVFLLVRPGQSSPCAAGFFFWEEGEIRRQATYREFVFSRKEHEPAAPAPVERPAGDAPRRLTPRPAPPLPAPVSVPAPPLPAPVSVPAPVALARLVVKPPRPPRVRLRWTAGRKAIGIAALVLIGFGALEYAAVEVIHRWQGSAAADSSPSLRVERRGKYFQVNWNRSAPAVTNAWRGVLTITDGGNRQDIQLDSGQLRTGSVAYFPSTADVAFHLELQGAQQDVAESLRVVTAPRPAAEQVQTAKPPAAPPVRVEPPPTRVEAVAEAATPAQPVEKAQARRHRSRRYLYDDGL